MLERHRVVEKLSCCEITAIFPHQHSAFSTTLSCCYIVFTLEAIKKYENEKPSNMQICYAKSKRFKIYQGA